MDSDQVTQAKSFKSDKTLLHDIVSHEDNEEVLSMEFKNSAGLSAFLGKNCCMLHRRHIK